VESRYVQPNLDPQPGDEDNAGQSAEHLMYGAIAKQFVDERRVPINVVLDGVYAMYQRFGNFKGEKPAEMRQAVYDKNQAETQALFDQFEHDLRANSTDGYCYLITRQDRKAQIQSGTKFVEHVDGDHLEDAFADIKKAKEGPVKGYEEAMRYLIVDINPNPADLAAAITEFGPELEADIAMYQKRFIDRVN
jgi:hypothetical protein